MIVLPEPAAQSTMYFIGVTTKQSSIMRVFPQWAAALGIAARIEGVDLPIHADAEDYRRVTAFIKGDPLSRGALVTTHKIDLYHAASGLFDYLDPYARSFGELSSISKRGGQLRGHAKDPISAGLALDHFLPKGYWIKRPRAEACVLGAGGSALAVSAYMASPERGANIPAAIHMTNRSAGRLDEAARILADGRVPMSYHLCPLAADNDRVVERLPEGSLVINATGLGKDRPGSPLTDGCELPKDGVIWEFNYRGSLEFLRQAERRREPRALTLEDGWTYFIHGWTQVIAEVFAVDITGERLALCERIARAAS